MEEKSFRKTLRKKVKLLKMSNFAFFPTMFSMQSVSYIATLSSAASLNLEWSQIGVLGKMV